MNDLLALGEELHRCRMRTRKDAWVAMGGSLWAVYIMPFWTGFFLTWPPLFTALFLGAPAPLLAHPFWGPFLGIWYAASCAGVLAYHLRRPAVQVVLHERGFRYRRRLVPFCEVAAVRRGRIHGRIQRFVLGLNGWLASYSVAHRGAHGMQARTEEHSLIVELQTGEPWSMDGVLSDHEPADAQALIEHLERAGFVARW